MTDTTSPIVNEPRLLRPTIDVIGPGAFRHNMPCAVCGSRHAVFSTPEAVFKPCWTCQESWELRRIPWWVGLFTRRERSLP